MGYLTDIDPALYSETDQMFARLGRIHPSPGCVYAVVRDGSLLHSRALGVCDASQLTPTQVPPDTAYRIASMTKSFAAAAALILRDEGQLRLDQTVAEIVRDAEPPRVWSVLTEGENCCLEDGQILSGHAEF